MRKFLLFTAFASLSVISAKAHAWFVIFPIPNFWSGGSGDTCVPATAREGDTRRSANGDVMTVKAISGTSSRCRNPGLPVLATVEFTPSSFSSKAVFSLPDDFSQQSLSNFQKFNGITVHATSKTSDSGLTVTATKRDVISDLDTYVSRSREALARRLDEVEQAATSQVAINGLRGWRFETTGNVRNAFGTRYTYLTTILEGEAEVLRLEAWSRAANYEHVKADLTEIANTVKLAAPATATKPPQETDPRSAAARLRELDKLREDGIITQQDFDAKKKAILESM